MMNHRLAFYADLSNQWKENIDYVSKLPLEVDLKNAVLLHDLTSKLSQLMLWAREAYYTGGRSPDVVLV